MRPASPICSPPSNPFYPSNRLSIILEDPTMMVAKPPPASIPAPPPPDALLPEIALLIAMVDAAIDDSRQIYAEIADEESNDISYWIDRVEQALEDAVVHQELELTKLRINQVEKEEECKSWFELQTPVSPVSEVGIQLRTGGCGYTQAHRPFSFCMTPTMSSAIEMYGGESQLCSF